MTKWEKIKSTLKAIYNFVPDQLNQHPLIADKYERYQGSRLGAFLSLAIIGICCAIIVYMTNKPPEVLRKIVAGETIYENIYVECPFECERKKYTESKNAWNNINKNITITFKKNKAAEDEAVIKLKDLKKELEYISQNFSYRNNSDNYSAKKRIEDGKVPADIAYSVETLMSKDLRNVLKEGYEGSQHLFGEWEKSIRLGILTLEDYNDVRTKEASVQITSTESTSGKIHVEEAKDGFRFYTRKNLAKKITDQFYSFVTSNKDEEKQKMFTEFIEKILPAQTLTNKQEIETGQKVLVYDKYMPGELLFEKETGEGKKALDEEDVSIYNAYIKALNESKSVFDRTVEKEETKLKTIQLILMTLCLLSLIYLYLYLSHPVLLNTPRSIWILGIIIVISLLLQYASAQAFGLLEEKFTLQHGLSVLIMPFALPALLCSVILDVSASIYVGMLICVISATGFVPASTSLLSPNTFYAFLIGLFSCGTVGVVLRHVTNYKTFFTRSFLSIFIVLFLFSFCFATGLGFLEPSYWLQENTISKQREELTHSKKTEATKYTGEYQPGNIVTKGIAKIFMRKGESKEEFYSRITNISLALVGFPLANALLTPFLAMICFLLLEMWPLRCSTRMSYQEWNDSSNYIMRNLINYAPGTYRHSQNVANMVDKAAFAIGLNPGIVRVCAMYHDIGKIQNPDMFTENAGGNDCYANKTALEAANYIKTHVTYGIELAREYKLPPLVLKTIQSHHGTRKISFFYEKAKREQGNENVNEADFRYPGPLPRDKEIAMIMLADSCEAAVTSLRTKFNRELTDDELNNLFGKIFQDIWADGQLDESRLTLRELDVIKSVFMETIKGQHVARIAYPDEKKG